jgi:hypothetical protein
MAKDNAAPVLFEGLLQKPVISAFDSELRTSDGGATLLAAVDRRTGLTRTLAERLEDPRDGRLVRAATHIVPLFPRPKHLASPRERANSLP